MSENTNQFPRIDLRSDTVTQPTEEMRRAMAVAEVGDDYYGEDPSINRLEARAMEIFGREAAMYVPSGTMSNQIAIKLHTSPGQEVLCEQNSHVYRLEMGMIAWFSGCQVRPVPTDDGKLDWAKIEPFVAAPAYCRPHTGLISMENTHNLAGGAVTSCAAMEEICGKAHERGIAVHLDGARIFNAALVLGVGVQEATRGFDTVSVCLSKGLGAPVGSVLLGSAEKIREARNLRKALGGGMRQAGVLAAAGLIALEKGPLRLAEDHANAKLLAQGLAAIPGLRIDPSRVESNIVIFDISGTGMNSADLAARLRERGVLANGLTPESMRMVTHRDVSAGMCREALRVLGEIVQK
jgi:threonine aldolase